MSSGIIWSTYAMIIFQTMLSTSLHSLKIIRLIILINCKQSDGLMYNIKYRSRILSKMGNLTRHIYTAYTLTKWRILFIQSTTKYQVNNPLY